MWRHTLSAVALWGTLLGGVVESQTTPPPERQVDSMRVEMLVPRNVASGRPVAMKLRVSNTSDRPITLYLQGRPIAFDIVIQRSGGEVVWRRLAGATVSAILGVRTLAPGETLDLEETWKQRTQAGKRAGPGDYLVSGSVLTDGQPIRAGPVPLRIG
jgi:hypothetical protein